MKAEKSEKVEKLQLTPPYFRYTVRLIRPFPNFDPSFIKRVRQRCNHSLVTFSQHLAIVGPRWRLGGVLTFTILLSGCVLSVEPVIPESAATLDQRLLGVWEEVAGTDRASVSRAAENRHAIEYTSDGKVSRFEARLGQLGKRTVLDVWPIRRDSDLPDASLLVAGHFLLVLDIDSDQIRVATLEPDSLLAVSRAGGMRASRVGSENQLILQGATEELRSALGLYLARPGALVRNHRRYARAAAVADCGGLAGTNGPPVAVSAEGQD